MRVGTHGRTDVRTHANAFFSLMLDDVSEKKQQAWCHKWQNTVSILSKQCISPTCLAFVQTASGDHSRYLELSHTVWPGLVQLRPPQPLLWKQQRLPLHSSVRRSCARLRLEEKTEYGTARAYYRIFLH